MLHLLNLLPHHTESFDAVVRHHGKHGVTVIAFLQTDSLGEQDLTIKIRNDGKKPAVAAAPFISLAVFLSSARSWSEANEITWKPQSRCQGGSSDCITLEPGEAYSYAMPVTAYLEIMGPKVHGRSVLGPDGLGPSRSALIKYDDSSANVYAESYKYHKSEVGLVQIGRLKHVGMGNRLTLLAR